MSKKPSASKAGMRSHWNRNKYTPPLMLDHTTPIDYLTAPPEVMGGEECANIARPCNRYQCPNNLHTKDSMCGKPHHDAPADPKIRADRSGPSCAIDEARANPDGMVCDDIGATMGITGERVRQDEHSGFLKMENVNILLATHEALRSGALRDIVFNGYRLCFKPGLVDMDSFPHNDMHKPGVHFVTSTIKIDHRKDNRQRDPHSGVMVRKRKSR